MKRFGFTLMEVVVVLGIIGVVAAITIPISESLIPDKDKIAVLKAYKIITDVNAEIKEDKSIWQEYQEDRGQTGWSKNLVSGNNYPDVFINQMDVVSGSRTSYGRGEQFKTNDGNIWIVEDPENEYGTVTIDLDDDKKGRCSYSSTCQKPGQFKFVVDAETLNIKPGDALTAAYLANAAKLNDRKADYKTARNDDRDYNY